MSSGLSRTIGCQRNIKNKAVTGGGCCAELQKPRYSKINSSHTILNPSSCTYSSCLSPKTAMASLQQSVSAHTLKTCAKSGANKDSAMGAGVSHAQGQRLVHAQALMAGIPTQPRAPWRSDGNSNIMSPFLHSPLSSYDVDLELWQVNVSSCEHSCHHVPPGQQC